MDEAQALLKELRVLNEHLADFKTMLAPYLGYTITEEPLRADLESCIDRT